MRIGIDARFYRKETAGIGRYTRGLLGELGKLDTSNEYVIFLTSKDMQEYQSPGENFQPVEVNIDHYSLAEQTQLPKIIKEHHLDLIHYTNFNHPIFGSVPFVITIHDLIMTFYPVGRKQKSFIRKLAYNLEMKHAARSSKQVIVPSGASKNDIVKMLGAKPEKVSVTYEGIDDLYLKPVSEDDKVEIRRKYSLWKPYLLFVSSWRPHKGILPLLEAYQLLRQKYKDDIQLVLVGKVHPDFEDIKAKVEAAQDQLDGIITPGFVPDTDLPGLYAAAEIFVLPSLYEGFCLTHLEAMAQGTAVVTSKTSCMPEVLGEGAVYFDPQDPHDIARVLDRLINHADEREQLANLGKKQAQKYSWEKMAAETLKIYEKALKG